MKGFGQFEAHDIERIFMPNEIFADLQPTIPYSGHVAFAYCYYWLACYMYRYCKYSSPDYGLVGQKKLKALLGVSEINKRLDYIIKKDGVLDRIGYTETTLDYPLYWELEALTRKVEFSTVNELKHSDILPYAINDRNYKIKKPVKQNDSGQENAFAEEALYIIELLRLCIEKCGLPNSVRERINDFYEEDFADRNTDISKRISSVYMAFLGKTNFRDKNDEKNATLFNGLLKNSI